MFPEYTKGVLLTASKASPAIICVEYFDDCTIAQAIDRDSPLLVVYVNRCASKVKPNGPLFGNTAS